MMIQPPADPPSRQLHAAAMGLVPEYDGPDLVEPSDAELCGLWPDPFAGVPEGAEDWLAELGADELDALFGRAGTEAGDAEANYAVATELLDALAPGTALAGLAQDALEAGLGQLSDCDLMGLLGA